MQAPKVQNAKPAPDLILKKIAEYVQDYVISSEVALKTAYIALLDSMACAMLALQEPACVQLLGPIIPGTKVPNGVRVPGTAHQLDPSKAAFDIGTCIRWLDFNDSWLALEWGHPSDNLGGILAVADEINRRKIKVTVYDILIAMIKAYEIQGALALENAFNKVGLDHVLLVKLATAAVISKFYDFNKEETIALLSNVWLDGATLRTYRHAMNTGPRKSWAAGDAGRRAVELAWIVQRDKTQYLSAITAKHWGFSDALFRGNPVSLERTLECYVMENILFKVSFPAEFHAQTAVEAAILLYNSVKDKWDNIEKIELGTQEAGFRIIHKEGPLYNYADRDHCLQYMVAIGLLFGELTAHHYSDEIAKDPRIDKLRAKMIVKENPEFTLDYFDPDKRAIANSVQIFYKDGTKTDKVTVEYPLGHKRRRVEAEPLLKEKYDKAIESHFQGVKAHTLKDLWINKEEFLKVAIDDWLANWVV